MSDSDCSPCIFPWRLPKPLYKKELRLHTLTLISAIRFKQKRMRKAGLEPARYCYHRHLKPARLPIPPLPHFVRCIQLFKKDAGDGT